MTHRLLNLAVAFDQFLFCVITLGHSDPDETISAAAFRWEKAGRIQGRVLRPLIDRLFWLDPKHCEMSYNNEQ